MKNNEVSELIDNLLSAQKDMIFKEVASFEDDATRKQCLLSLRAANYFQELKIKTISDLCK